MMQHYDRKYCTTLSSLTTAVIHKICENFNQEVLIIELFPFATKGEISRTLRQATQGVELKKDTINF